MRPENGAPPAAKCFVKLGLGGPKWRPKAARQCVMSANGIIYNTFRHAVSPTPNSSDTCGRRCHRDPVFAIHYKHGPRPGGLYSRTLRNFIPGRHEIVELELKYNGRNPSFNFLSNSTFWSRPGMKFRKVRELCSPGRGPCL